MNQRLVEVKERLAQLMAPQQEVQQLRSIVQQLEAEETEAKQEQEQAARKAAIRQCYQEMPVLVAQMRARAELQSQDAEKLQHVCDVLVGLSPLDSHGQLSGALRTAIDNELTLLSPRRWPQE